MSKEHAYAAKVTWTGSAKGPVRDYATYSREYRVEVESFESIHNHSAYAAIAHGLEDGLP